MIVEVMPALPSNRARQYAARVRFEAGNRKLTAVGQVVRDALDSVGGIDRLTFNPYSFEVVLGSANLWPWCEVEPQIAAAVEAATGERVELARAPSPSGRMVPQVYPSTPARH